MRKDLEFYIMNAKRFVIGVVITLGCHQFIVAQTTPAPWREQLEHDWRLQARLDAEGRRATEVTTQDDAAGGCDGVTNGKWGFHTGEQENPWWQVDLGEVLPLAQVRLWNRADNGEAIAKRAARFEILLSNDAQIWS